MTVAGVNIGAELLGMNKGNRGKDRVVPLSANPCQYLANYTNAIRTGHLKLRKADRLFVLG